jgi:hypothetical protein
MPRLGAPSCPPRRCDGGDNDVAIHHPADRPAVAVSRRSVNLPASFVHPGREGSSAPRGSRRTPEGSHDQLWELPANPPMEPV